MSRTQERLIMGIAGVVVVVAAGYFMWNWRPANNADHPDGTFWICQNPQCNHEFVLSVKELGKFQETHYGQPVMCPKCKQQNTVGAERCPSCSKFISRAQRAAVCPHCKAKISQ